MAQATLLADISAEVVSQPIRLFSPQSITVQFTPRRDGYTGSVVIEVSLVPNIASGYLWYSIPTIGLNPWVLAATLEFSGHSEVVAFTLRLNPGLLWIRASVTDYLQGTVSAYIAH